jgi:hypothetical protein
MLDMTHRKCLYSQLTPSESGRRHERFLSLPGAEDSAELNSAYWLIRSGTSELVQSSLSTSWAALAQSCHANTDWMCLELGMLPRPSSSG